jgi:hypothetical protein
LHQYYKLYSYSVFSYITFSNMGPCLDCYRYTTPQNGM